MKNSGDTHVHIETFRARFLTQKQGVFKCHIDVLSLGGGDEATRVHQSCFSATLSSRGSSFVSRGAIEILPSDDAGLVSLRFACFRIDAPVPTAEIIKH